MDHVQFLNVLSGKKCVYKKPGQIQDCICTKSVVLKDKKCFS